MSGLGLNGGGFMAQASIFGLLHTVIHAEAILLLKLAASAGEFVVVKVRSVPGQAFRVNHIIRGVQVDVAGIFVDAAMPLVLGETKG